MLELLVTTSLILHAILWNENILVKNPSQTGSKNNFIYSVAQTRLLIGQNIHYVIYVLLQEVKEAVKCL